MKFSPLLQRAVMSALLLGAGRFSVPGHATAITGNPADDLWTLEGLSSSAANYNNGAGAYNFNIYTTAFSLDAASLLLSNAGAFSWNVNDVVAGVGGVFTGPNADLTYDGPGGATSTRFVVKYGTAGATWLPNSPSSGSPGFGSLAHGGVGSVLLGTFAYDFSPANSGTLIMPNNSPLEQTGVSSTTVINGAVGRVITAWSGGLVGFESFINLTLLNAQYPDNGVALGNKFIVDLQKGTGVYQDSQGTLPTAAPEPGSLMLLLAGAGLALLPRRRS